ncbi:MAG: GH92 family glycosyl hydrolase [Prevotellaceae bacterium]|nr:GH92 family glycosyl hydrolase [Prevotellaceae bacterium]
MKKLIFLLALVPMLFACNSSSDSNVDYSAIANPMIGTDFTGNTYPGAQAPFGMVQLSPDNGLPGWDRIAGYFYPDSTIAGFSHTHLSGTGCGDLYDVSFMPVMLPAKVAEEPLGIHSKFSHDEEQASAGYYQVRLADYGINVELTATPRCGVQRYTFPEGDAAIILNLRKAMNWDFTDDTYLEVVDSQTVRGYRFSEGWCRDQRLYFYTHFSRPFEGVEIDSADVKKDDKVVGKSHIATFKYTTKKADEVVITTALSPVSMEGAEANFKAELPSGDFNEARDLARDMWNTALSKIEVIGGTDDQRAIFYTAMYHAMIAPTLFSDVDGGYRGPDGKNHKTDGWDNYCTFSIWDTFRAAHPLYTCIMPSRVKDMVQSFIAFYEQNGRLPVWNLWGGETDMMIGYHSAAVIAEAYLKGIEGFDAEKALEACVKTANLDEYRGIGQYKQQGFIGCDVVDPYNGDDWSLSRTLEYAFDDYCIARMAEKMGKKDIADEFYKRSQNYRNVYNPASTFMQPRLSNGEFEYPFNPDDYTKHICESNAWHYFWSVQHDIPGLIELVGGKERFIEKLDSMFTYNPSADADLPLFSTGMIGQYAHGNEPSHHVIYLYNKVGQPEKTQKYAAQVMRELYLNTPAGLCGNEDCGQTSAWYVFSAMGLYPVNPVSCEYEIGSPIFPEVRMHLENGKTFTVKANNVSAEHIYVKSATLNGKPLDRTFITHDEILAGGTLELEMK